MNVNDLLREVLEDEARRHAGPHLEPGEMFDYAAGRMGEEEERRVQDHFVACQECAGVYLELAPLADADDPERESQPRRPDNVTEFAAVAGWRELQDRLAAEIGRRSPWWLQPRWAWATAAGLLAATVVLGGWSLALDSANRALEERVAGLSGPQPDPEILYLDAATRGAEAALPASGGGGSGLVLLVLAPDAVEPLPAYVVEIHGAGGAVWTGSLRTTELGTVRLAVPRERLPAGDYRAVLLEPDGDRRAGEYAFRVGSG